MLEQKIETIISSPLQDKGYDIVRIQYSQKILQILIERKDLQNISIDDCNEVSRLVSTLLDVEDPIRDQYFLEVSSPGLDRPLIKLKDFNRFIGHEAKFLLQSEVNRRKKIKGKITKIEDKTIFVMDEQGQELLIDFDNLTSTHLVPKINLGQKKNEN